jgi:hypothetical protein
VAEDSILEDGVGMVLSLTLQVNADDIIGVGFVDLPDDFLLSSCLLFFLIVH